MDENDLMPVFRAHDSKLGRRKGEESWTSSELRAAGNSCCGSVCHTKLVVRDSFWFSQHWVLSSSILILGGDIGWPFMLSPLCALLSNTSQSHLIFPKRGAMTAPKGVLHATNVIPWHLKPESCPVDIFQWEALDRQALLVLWKASKDHQQVGGDLEVAEALKNKSSLLYRQRIPSAFCVSLSMHLLSFLSWEDLFVAMWNGSMID